MKLATASQMREIDAAAIEKYGISSQSLMENAGKGVAEILLKKIKKTESVAVIAGKGNNGGDGMVAARYLIENGIKVHLALTEQEPVEKIKDVLKKTDIIVDAIFGTGLKSEVTGKHREIIDVINESEKFVLSVDIPSGLSGDTGEVLGKAVKADMTVTFGLPKVGHVLSQGPEYTGELKVIDIGFPPELIEKYKTDLHLITPEMFRSLFKARKSDAHKNDFGHLLVVAGSTGKMGAGWLSSKAALRSGAGLVTYALPEAAFEHFDTNFAEVMVESLPDKRKGHFVPESIEAVRRAAHGKDAVAFGPGIGTGQDTAVFTASLLSKLTMPLVVDADALTNLAGNLFFLKKRTGTTVLTPHPGEMSRLLGIDKKDLMKNRIGLARNFAAEYGVILVLKGHRTLVAAPDGNVYVNPTGNPGMATAGTGDALTGIIGSFLAQKFSPLEAVLAAVYIHGMSGDIAASVHSEVGMITSDLIEKIPDAIKIITCSEAYVIARNEVTKQSPSCT